MILCKNDSVPSLVFLIMKPFKSGEPVAQQQNRDSRRRETMWWTIANREEFDNNINTYLSLSFSLSHTWIQ